MKQTLKTTGLNDEFTQGVAGQKRVCTSSKTASFCALSINSFKTPVLKQVGECGAQYDYGQSRRFYLFKKVEILNFKTFMVI